MTRPRSFEFLYENRTMPIPESGCLIWMGAADTHGYGIYRRGAKTYLAHRGSWEMKHGEIKNGLCVLHKCDVPSCINPDHLFLGTKSENAKDRHRKGRSARGEKAGNALFTEAEIREIRRLDKEIKTLQFKLREFKKRGCEKNFTEILHNRLWKHVN